MRLGLLTPAQNEHFAAVARRSVEAAINACTEMQDGKRVVPAAKWPAPESAGDHIRADDTPVRQLPCRERADFTTFKPLGYVNAVAAATLHNMRRDTRIVVFGEDVANLRGGPYGATRGIKEVFPERLINTPISETGFVGMAGGLAVAGLKPVVEVMFPDFALMASDQLFNQIGKLRHMFGGQATFPVLVRTRVATGVGYGGQHSMDPSGYFAQFSGWRIVAPSNAFDAIGLFNTALKFNDPVLFLEHGLLYAEESPVPATAGGEYDLDYYVAYGKARVARAGRDLTVLTYLTGVRDSLKAAEALAGQGLSAEVLDLRTLDYAGMDFATIGASVKKTGAVLIVEQGARSWTIGARVAEEVQARFFDFLDCPIQRVAALDVPLPVSRKLEEAVLPSLEQIRSAMQRVAQRQV
jgi:2-oxoisovalerate dehydrogenase E1 component